MYFKTISLIVTYFLKIQHLGERHSRHLAVESSAHPLHDPVTFHWSVKGWLYRLSLSGSHHQLSILCHNLSVADFHNGKLNLLDDPLLDDRQMEFLQI